MNHKELEILHKKRLRNKGALIGAGVGAVAGGAANYFRKNKDERSAKDALIGAGVGAAAGGGVGAGMGHHVGGRDMEVYYANRKSGIAGLDKKKFSDRRVLGATKRLLNTVAAEERKEETAHIREELKRRRSGSQ